MPTPINPYVAGAVPGLYAYDYSNPGYVNVAMFANSDFITYNGVVTPTHQSYASIGPSLTADFLDPTIYGDMSMGNRRMCFDVANNMLYADACNFGDFNLGTSSIFPI